MSEDLQRFLDRLNNYILEWTADARRISGHKMSLLWQYGTIAARFPPSVYCCLDEIDGIFIHSGSNSVAGIRIYLGAHPRIQTAVQTPEGEITPLGWDSVPDMVEYVVTTLKSPPEVGELQRALGGTPTLTGCTVDVSDTLKLIASFNNNVYTSTFYQVGENPRGGVIHHDLDTIVRFITATVQRCTRRVDPPAQPLSKSARVRARKKLRDKQIN
jgi:hypothetical protein